MGSAGGGGGEGGRGRADRVLFSSVGLWEGFLGVRITPDPLPFCRM